MSRPDDERWIDGGPLPADLERLADALAPLAALPPEPDWALVPSVEVRAARPRATRRSRIKWLAAAGIAAALAVEFAAWLGDRPSRTWNVEPLTGAPTVRGTTLTTPGRIREGDWIETAAGVTARLRVGVLGTVQLAPGTRLTLVSAREGDQRLWLARGEIVAHIWAAPRQFFVQTSSALAVDLGCAYALAVDSLGTGTLRVTSGWVALADRGREAFVPSGASCTLDAEHGPGVPMWEDAPPALRVALSPGASIDRLTTGLEAARRRDAFTLWHLGQRGEGEFRRRVFTRLAEWVPPPDGTSIEAAIAGDRRVLDLWWNALGLGDSEFWRTWRGPKLRKQMARGARDVEPR